MDNLGSVGLWILVGCPKAFLTEPKHFSRLKRSMESMCVSSACTFRSMGQTARFQTPGNGGQILISWSYYKSHILCIKLFYQTNHFSSFVLFVSLFVGVFTYRTSTVFTSLSLGCWGLLSTMKFWLGIWNMSRNLGMFGLLWVFVSFFVCLLP